MCQASPTTSHPSWHLLLIASQPFAQQVRETMHARLEWWPVWSQPWVWPEWISHSPGSKSVVAQPRQAACWHWKGFCGQRPSFLWHFVDSQRLGSAWTRPSQGSSCGSLLILKRMLDSAISYLESSQNLMIREEKKKSKQQNSGLHWSRALLLFSIIQITAIAKNSNK